MFLIICVCVLITTICGSPAVIQNHLIETALQPKIGQPNGPSKLRALFFPELYKSFQESNVDLDCSSNTVLRISTQKCSCKTYLCSDNDIPSRSRSIDTKCEEVCCGDHKTVSRSVDNSVAFLQLRRRRKCGVGKINGRNSLQANNTIIDEFPWTVQIISRSSKTPFCTGALIHPRIVLTTGVCIFMQQYEDLNILANNEFDQQEIKVKEKRIHEKFPLYLEELNYNVALLVLEKSIEVNNFVNVICLPPKNPPMFNIGCLVSSWEIDSEQKDNVVVKGPFTIIPNSICQQEHKQRRNKYEVYFHKGNICASSGRIQNIEIKSSGAPLICPVESSNDNQYSLNGILAWSTRINKSPHIFTNVAGFRNWMGAQMLTLGIDIEQLEY